MCLPIVPDEIEDREPLLRVAVAAQAATELLQEHRHRLGWAQEHHEIDARDVDPLIEQVDREQHSYVAASQPLDCLGSLRTVGARVNGERSDACLVELFCHEPRVFDRDAEPERGI